MFVLRPHCSPLGVHLFDSPGILLLMAYALEPGVGLVIVIVIHILGVIGKCNSNSNNNERLEARMRNDLDYLDLPMWSIIFSLFP